MRGSSSAELGAITSFVSAWATQANLTLGQVAVDKKSNEITAIPTLLEQLDLQGPLVTIDAMGCQKQVAKKIVDRGGDYLLAVKGNQEHLLEDIQTTVEKALNDHWKKAWSRQYTTRENGHGRHEERSYVVVHNIEGIRDIDVLSKASTVGMCRCERTVAGKSCVPRSITSWVTDVWEHGEHC